VVLTLLGNPSGTWAIAAALCDSLSSRGCLLLYSFTLASGSPYIHGGVG
jgi:hypothetical protein